jgi:hypothetical protein
MNTSSASYVVSKRHDVSDESCTEAIRRILDCHAKKRGRLPDKSGPDDAKGSVDDRAEIEYTG